MPSVAERTDPGAARRAILERMGQGDLLGGSELGSRYLEAAADAAIALEVIKAMASVGLGVPAREILVAHEERLRDAGVDVDALGRSLASVPTGRVAWDESEATFAANLAILGAERPWLATIEPHLRSAMREHQLFRTAAGHLQLSCRTRGGARRWVPGLIDWVAAAPADLRLEPSGHSLAVIGAGAHDLVERAHRLTCAAPGTYQPPVMLLEPEWARLALWLHAADRATLLRDPRVLVFAGPDASRHLADHLALHEDLEPPRVLLRAGCDEPVWRRVRSALDSITTARAHLQTTFTRVLDDRARERSRADWAARLTPGATILGLVSRFTTVLKHSMRDISQTLESMGYRFRLVTEATDHSFHTTLTTARAVAEIDPALVIMINHLRRELPAFLGAVPVLTWIQDPVPVLLCGEAGASIGPHDFVCGFYADRCVQECGYPRDRFHSIHFVPVSQREFHDAPVPPNEVERFESDLVYVGHAQGTALEFLERAASTHPPELRPTLDAVAAEVRRRASTGEHLDQAGALPLVREVARRRGARLEEPLLQHLASFFAHRLFDIQFRLETLEWAAAWARRRGRRFRIFGRGWDTHPTFAPFAQGPVEHGEESRLAYRGARLSLQTIPVGLAHQRTFEGLLCGSLVLARYSPADFSGLAAQEFRARFGDGSAANRALYQDGFRGLHRVVFSSAAELDALAERYLGDEPARRSVTDELAELVRASFTYDGVVPPLVDSIRRNLKR